MLTTDKVLKHINTLLTNELNLNCLIKKYKMEITLRKNQIEPVDIGIKYFKENKPKPAIIVAPTAFGKSIVIAKIANSIKDNLLVLQPSKELLEQNISKYIMLGGTAEIYSASLNRKKIASTTYATIGSIKSLGKTFKELGFSKMIIDESHLYPRTIESMLGKFLTDSEITHVLGLTATPLKLQTNYDRYSNAFSKLAMLTSRSKKGNFFKEILYVAQIKEMVENNYWSKLNYLLYDVNEQGLVYNSVKSDYTEKSLSEMYEKNNLTYTIIEKVNELSKVRRGIIVFVPSVNNAERLSISCPRSAVIHSKVKPKERAKIISQFKQGIIKTIFNVNVLSVGFDYPELDTIICARPTASLSWYYQAFGRGTRIAEGKEECLIIDYSSSVKKFGKIESLYYEKINGRWELYGENNNKLTGIPLHEIGEHKKVITNGKILMPFGKYKGKEVKSTPLSYRSWMIDAFEWNSSLQYLKDEIIKCEKEENSQSKNCNTKTNQ